MKGARQILVERLRQLMRAKNWYKPGAKEPWDVSALHKAVKGSKRWLYRLLRGEVNFTIDKYEQILNSFDPAVSFESIMAGFTPSEVSEDVEDLYSALKDAIRNAQQTRTIEAFRYALFALRDKTASDLAFQGKARGPTSQQQRVGNAREMGSNGKQSQRK